VGPERTLEYTAREFHASCPRDIAPFQLEEIKIFPAYLKLRR
jgi:hypothetical protein